MRATARVALLLLCLAHVAGAQLSSVFTARVVGVLDGDSLVVLRDGREVQLRLHGIDAPEGGQAFGSVCKRALSNLVFGKTVTVEVVDIDRFQRSVSRVAVEGGDVGLEMIRGGFAWHYRQYSNDARYAAAEMDARRARRGLWQDARPTAPWDYRRARSTRNSSPAGRSLLAAPADKAAGPFHGNVSSHVFHAPGCPNYDCKNCTAVFATREAAMAAGYRPHVECAGR